jgi:hypothetical protein
VQRWAATGVDPGDNVGTALLLREIGRQAAAIAYSNDFHLLGFATLLVLPMVLLIRTTKTNPSTPVDVVEG